MEFIVMYFLFYGYVCPSCFEMFAIRSYEKSVIYWK